MTQQVEPVELSERDKELIDEGQRLVRRMDTAQLRVGRLALEFAPMGERGYRSGAGVRTEMYAERVGLQTSTLKVYRGTAHAWSVTDISDNEFSFSLLQTLVSVGDKEGLVALLRKTKPPSGRARWGAQEALDLAVAKGYLPSPTNGVSPEQRREIASGRTRTVTSGAASPASVGNGPNDTPRNVNLGFVGETLRKMSFKSVDAKQREELDPLLAKVEGEAARLRRELNAVR